MIFQAYVSDCCIMLIVYSFGPAPIASVIYLSCFSPFGCVDLVQTRDTHTHASHRGHIGIYLVPGFADEFEFSPEALAHAR